MSKITGINHILITVSDMNKTVDFFVNILGLKVKATGQRTVNVYPGSAESGAEVKRLYFFQASDGSMITCAEMPAVKVGDVSPVLPAYWPDSTIVGATAKVDHIAFNVESRDDLVYYQNRLRAHNIEVSEIFERATKPKFVKSIYFRSPDGLPLEICTWDFNDPTWQAASKDNYLTDPNPVPALKISQDA